MTSRTWGEWASACSASISRSAFPSTGDDQAERAVPAREPILVRDAGPVEVAEQLARRARARHRDQARARGKHAAQLGAAVARAHARERDRAVQLGELLVLALEQQQMMPIARRR